MLNQLGEPEQLHPPGITMNADQDVMDVQFEREPTIVTRKVAGEVILVPVTQRMGREAALYTLDDVAAFLWDLLDGDRTGHDLVEALKSRYTFGGERPDDDVRTYLEQLRSIEVIRPATMCREAPNEGSEG